MAEMLRATTKGPSSMSFTGAMAALFVDGSCPLRLSASSPDVRRGHVCSGFREIAWLIQRGPEVQQRLGLIAALTNRHRAPGIALTLAENCTLADQG